MNFYVAGFAFLCTATMGCAAPPHSKPPETVTATVQLRDIDLSTARGMVVARSRIAAVALRLCERFRNTSSVSDSQTAADCQRDAVADAMQRLEQSAQIATRNGEK